MAKTTVIRTASKEYLFETRDYGLKLFESTDEKVPKEQRLMYAIFHKEHGVMAAGGNQLSGAIRAMHEMQKDLNLAIEGKDRELSPMEKAALLSLVQPQDIQSPRRGN